MDSRDCQCAVRRLCPLEDADGNEVLWWELCEGDPCKWRPLIDALLLNTTATQAAAICDWIIDTCGDELCELLAGEIGCKTTRIQPSVFTNPDGIVWTADPANQNTQICWGSTALPSTAIVNNSCSDTECTVSWSGQWTIYQGVTPPSQGPAVFNGDESSLFLSIQSDVGGSVVGSPVFTSHNYGGNPLVWSSSYDMVRGPFVVAPGGVLTVGGQMCFVNNGPNGFIPDRISLRAVVTCCTAGN